MVSGKRSVEKMPVKMKKANISRLEGNIVQMIFVGERDEKTYICFTNLLVPPMLIRCAKPTCATMAPSLPLAAEIP